MHGADPVDGALDLAVGAFHARARFRIQPAAQLGDGAVGILDHLIAADDAGAAQAYFATRNQALPALRRHFGEVLAVDPHFASERHLAAAEAFVLRMVAEGQLLFVAFGQVGQHQLDRVDHGHAARRGAVQVFAQRAFQHAEVDQRILLADAHALGEQAHRCRRVPTAAQALQGRHARVFPAVHQLLGNQRHQLALAHHRVVDVQARELDLARLGGFARQAGVDQRLGQRVVVGEIHVVHAPVVQRAVVFEFQRAQRVGDALDRIAQRVREVVHRVDRPRIAGVLVFDVLDAVQGRIAQVDVAAGHVDLGAQGARTIREFTGAHAAEQVEVLLDAAVAPRRRAARLGQGATVGAHFLGRQVADIGLALFDQLLGGQVVGLEVVRGVAQLVPLEAQPAHVVLDRGHVFRIFLGRVGVVEAQIDLAWPMCR
ncbi:hypothetical protein G6F31_014032 [Rhizopus arrhizus]|nr:hypothetical protein G6F31_014032 [Rhizopus arrhizus]